MSRRVLRFALVTLLVVLSSMSTFSRTVQNPSGGAYAHVGFQAQRGYFSQFSWERIDMVNGGLTLTIPLLALPGSGGMDLRITRHYSRQQELTPGQWAFSFTDVPLAIQLPTSGSIPTLIMGDGSRKTVQAAIVGSYLVTTDFWRYDATARKLFLPDGREATYLQTGDLYGQLPLQQVEDPFGNRLNVYWDPGPGLYVDRVDQTIGGAHGLQTRTVEFTWSAGFPTVSYEGKSWVNTAETIQGPTGPPWGFAAEGLPTTTALTVTVPTGGTVRYEFVSEEDRWRVATITTGGRAIASGTWQLGYSYDVFRYGTITFPGGRVLTFKHQFLGNADGTDWVLRERTLAHGGSSTSTQFDYENVPFGAGWLNALKRQIIAQDGLTYTTEYDYTAADFYNYLRPWRMTETASYHATARVTTREYDGAFHRYILPKVGSTTVNVAGESFTSSVTYDDWTGFPTSQTQLGITSQLAPDSAGNLASATDAAGHQVTSSFTWGVPETTTSAAGSVQRQINSDGTVATVTEGGATTSFTHDALGRVTSVTPAAGAATSTTYAPDASWVSVSRDGSGVTTTVDGFGRPVATEDAAGVRTVTTYDHEGRIIFRSGPYTTGAPSGDTYQYDTLGRLTRVTHSDGTYVEHTELADPLGSRVYIRDENGRYSQQIWQAFGGPTDRRLYLLKDADDKWWRYTYNAVGSLTRIEGPAGPDRVWVYNANNRLVSETHPESGTTTYAYRSDGLLESRTTGLGTTVYAYDGDHRLTGIDAPGTADDTWIGYDGRGNRDLVIMGNGNQTVFTNDLANRVTGREERVGGQIFMTTFEYDTRDNLKKITYPSNRTVQYDYDSADRLTRVYSGTQTYADNIAYHPSGARSALTFGNGVTESLTLDDRHRPSHLLTGAASDRVDLTYAYDPAGNVLSVTDPRPGMSSSFGYDALDRLTSVTGFGANTYTYDALGNRLTKASTGTTYTYNYSTNRLESATSSVGAPEAGTFTYDSVGNMTGYSHGPSGVNATYDYSPRNTMTRATLNGLSTDYAYDADGLRIQKSSASGQQYYIRGLGGQLLAEYAAFFAKSAPSSGSTTTSTSVQVQWTPVVGATNYLVCWDSTNNNVCDGAWQANGTSTVRQLTGLSAGTYYWQVKAETAAGTGEADNGTWWSVTVSPSLFGKQGPPSGQLGLGTTVTLQWDSVPDSGYWVCWDTTNNNSCDGMWWPNGGGNTRVLENLTAATYYWQIRAQTPTGLVDADGGIWWSFTVGGGAGGPSKLAPAPDLAGLSSNVLTQWTALPDDGSLICWDTTNNNSCDTAWWPNGGATMRVLEGLSPGTYYWQVKAASTGSEFNNGTWWAFTVGAPPVSFNKLTPGNGAILTTNNATLSWTTASGASFYETCVDSVNNGICDTSWVTAAQATSRTLSGLTDGTYYWQVRATTASGVAPADNGAWWSFTIDAPDPIREYIYLGGQLLASLTLTTATPVLTYYHTDVLGSVRAITSATGAPLARHDYAPFGESATPPFSGDPRRFTGLERDAETAFDYAAARYFRSVWGRFTSADDSIYSDPLNPQTFNQYAYVSNNPLKWVDPSGHQQECATNECVTVRGEMPGAIPFAVAMTYLTLREGLLALGDYWEAKVEEARLLRAYRQVYWDLVMSGDEDLPNCGPDEGCMMGIMPVLPARIGIATASGAKIRGFTTHGADRVIGNAGKRFGMIGFGEKASRAGVRPRAILDAVRNPRKWTQGVDNKGRPFEIFYGQSARVVLNPSTGRIVSVNPLRGGR